MMAHPEDNLPASDDSDATYWLNASTEEKFAEVAKINALVTGKSCRDAKVARVLSFHQWSLEGDPPVMKITNSPR